MAVRWFVVETLPRQEARADAELAAQQFETLFPRFIRARRRRMQSLEAPLFPGYLFVSFDARMDDWAPVKSTRGVRRLLTEPDGAPIPLPVRVAAQLAEHFAAGPVPDLEEALLPFRRGTRLRILDGTFAGWVAVCERSTRARVWVLLSLLGRSVAAEFDCGSVEVAA